LEPVQQPEAGVELHGVVSSGAQQWREAPKRKRKQERESASAGDACGDGVANDPVATWVQGTPEMGPRLEQSHAQPSGEEESRCGNSAAIGRGFVEGVYGASGG